MNPADWHNWRGATNEKMNALEERIDEHCSKLDELDKALAGVANKLMVPLFCASIFGVAVGGIIIALIGKALAK